MANFTREEIEHIVHKLERADLARIDLSGADLRGANLMGARFMADTIWPEGFDPVAAGALLDG